MDDKARGQSWELSLNPVEFQTETGERRKQEKAAYCLSVCVFASTPWTDLKQMI